MMNNTPKIITTYDPKPIPIRQFDWTAYSDELGGDGPVGTGLTEQDAIDDLMEQLEND